MAIGANQRLVNLSEAYVRERFPNLFEDNEKIVEVSFRHDMQPGVPDQITFIVEKQDEETQG